MAKALSHERKKDLLEEFNRLQTLKEKLKFWTEKMPVNYIEYHELGTSDERFDELKEFQIPIREFEQEDFARWVIANYSTLSKHPKLNTELLDFETLASQFRKRLELEEEKDTLVINEQLKIEGAFERREENSFGSIRKITHLTYSANSYNANYEAFLRGKKGLQPDYKHFYPHLHTIKQVNNGYVLGHYWRYLDNLQSSNGEETSELSEKVEQLEKLLSEKEKGAIPKGAQMLLLFHLGLIDEVAKVGTNKEQIGKLLGALLNISSEDAERDYLKVGAGKSKVYDTERNYAKLTEYLESIGLKDLAAKVRKDKKVAQR